MNVTDHPKGLRGRGEITYQDFQRKHLGLLGWGKLDLMIELGTCKGFRWENQSLSGLRFNVSLCRFIILRQFQFMAILFLRFWVLSIGYHFVMIIPFGGLFIRRKGANIPVRRVVVFKTVLKRYCFPKTGLSSFYSAGRRGLKS